MHRELVEKRITELKSKINKGGLQEAPFAAWSMWAWREGSSMSAASRHCVEFASPKKDRG
jgi:hypothetical protein